MKIKSALINFKAETLRTLLAMLGILVGTASIVAMVSIGEMATEEALAQFKTLGTDLIAVSLSGSKDDAQSTREKFDLKDAENMQHLSPDIELIAPYTLPFAPISYRGIPIMGSIIGTTASLAEITHIRLLEGRFISPFDKDEKYCVLGYELYKQVKKVNANPLLSLIKLGDFVYMIIGIAEPWPENSFIYQDINHSILVPIKTSGFISKFVSIDNIIMRLKPNANINFIQQQIEGYLHSKAPDKRIFFRSAKELIKSMEAQHKIFTLLLSLIGSISLIVGGIGVMNIMLVSVLERRREIGIRLALGARRKEIQQMFLLEAVLLSVIGGILGVILGVVSSLIIGAIAHWHLRLFLLPPLIGFSVSVLIGIFFGYYPAYKAAQLKPIETLRLE